MPVTELFAVNAFVCVMPSGPLSHPPPMALAPVPAAMADPDPAPRGVIANPPKEAPPSVSVYSVSGAYFPEAGRAGEKLREYAPAPDAKVPWEGLEVAPPPGVPDTHTPVPAPLSYACAVEARAARAGKRRKARAMMDTMVVVAMVRAMVTTVATTR